MTDDKIFAASLKARHPLWRWLFRGAMGLLLLLIIGVAILETWRVGSVNSANEELRTEFDALANEYPELKDWKSYVAATIPIEGQPKKPKALHDLEARCLNGPYWEDEVSELQEAGNEGAELFEWLGDINSGWLKPVEIPIADASAFLHATQQPADLVAAYFKSSYTYVDGYFDPQVNSPACAVWDYLDFNSIRWLSSEYPVLCVSRAICHASLGNSEKGIKELEQAVAFFSPSRAITASSLHAAVKRMNAMTKCMRAAARMYPVPESYVEVFCRVQIVLPDMKQLVRTECAISMAMAQIFYVDPDTLDKAEREVREGWSIGETPVLGLFEFRVLHEDYHRMFSSDGIRTALAKRLRTWASRLRDDTPAFNDLLPEGNGDGYVLGYSDRYGPVMNEEWWWLQELRKAHELIEGYPLECIALKLQVGARECQDAEEFKPIAEAAIKGTKRSITLNWFQKGVEMVTDVSDMPWVERKQHEYEDDNYRSRMIDSEELVAVVYFPWAEQATKIK